MDSNLKKLRVLSGKLIEIESAFSAFWKLAPNLFLITSYDESDSRVIININEAAKYIMGYEPEELIGHEVDEFLHSDDLEKVKKARRDILQGNSITDFESRWRHKEGHYVPLIWNSIHNYSDKVIYAIGRPK